ncbi:hypothetical protein [Burkholderia plantarii]|uniref:Peptidase C39 n=1 Tax=Burkholderia plantarii TaxID=41899 RepID=A0A0B6S4V1_BURPL|nr:hypothetical protein [Burkholderia plantarii]AJK49404.1 hypothetical protein BGL_2c13370 [Burkholderia plantarii]
MNPSLPILRDASRAAARLLAGGAALALQAGGAGAALAGPGPAAAALAVIVVDDDVLARQTGKFADATMISGAVVNLLSQWQLPNGALAVAQGTLSVTANAANQLTAQVRTLARVVDGDAGQPAGNDPNASTAGGQAIRVNGVSQVTQVAGNGNTGNNAMSIDFSQGGAAPAVLPGASGATSAWASNGAGTLQASVSFSANGVTLALRTPAGIASQIVAPAAAQGGSIAQLMQIAGNRQLVSNQLQIQLRTQQMSAASLRQAGVLQALQNGFAARR